MSSVVASGVRLYYEDRGAGRPVVFVHGIPTDYRAWSAQAEPFSVTRKTVALAGDTPPLTLDRAT